MLIEKNNKIIKNINFLESVNRVELPGYIKHYIYIDELVLTVYKTERDYGIFTSKKMVLFDNNGTKGNKRIHMIPYLSICTFDILFEENDAVIDVLLNSGDAFSMKFRNVLPEDKVRLRILYTTVNRVLSGQSLLKADIKKLINNRFKLKKFQENKK